MTPQQPIEERKLVSRRDFIKFCGVVAGVLGINSQLVSQVLTAPERPPVLWLHFSECTGCTESILRTTGPWFDEVILHTISLDYHETLLAAAGSNAEELRRQIVNHYPGEFICIVEGSIPTADNGIYGTIGQQTMLSLAREIIPQAAVVLACGTCASYGGLAAAEPNPTGAMGVEDALPGLSIPLVNIPGCPPNPVNLMSVIVDYLLNNHLPELDRLKRPLFAYGSKIHWLCPYKKLQDCLFNEGCKGKWTFGNCPQIKFNDGVSFPMQAGHPCIGCVSPQFWDRNTPFYA